MNEPDAQTAPNYVTCPCQHCSGKIEFDANQLDSAENTTVPCPHCGLETIIFVPEQKVPPPVSDEDFHLRPAREVERDEEIRKTGIPVVQDNPAALLNLETVHAHGEGLPPAISDKSSHLHQIGDVEREGKQLSKPPANFGRIGEDEDIIQQCIEVIRRKKEASASLLNKELRLGYNRAAQILDELANRGIVGPFKYADAPRDILIDLDDGGYLRGNAKWQTDLGIAYFAQKDYRDEVKCFLVAAKQGFANAQRFLGNCYKEGWGVEKNEAEAVEWFSKAAEQGQPHAEFSLGVAYFFGRGIPKDSSGALQWLHKAAEHGNDDAQFMLGICYESGEGVVAQNYVEAYKWMKLASAKRHEGASQKCEEIVLKMNAEQIASVEPHDQMLWKRDRLALKRLSDFIGQNRIKERLELATAAARLRGQALNHILLTGPPGSGKATLANILAKVMGANIKATSGPTITKSK